ncbi:protease I [Xanthomonas campestris]|uniref:type 1 glutamine amidotransferase domain-containing protein n=1 Tax=Xanthomonas euroxanthea TaxID=2259622 RepID=UPI0016128467|nr:type 1 glutamine amidotransferase domain-containing protein [Xanthomonas euroxanthea]MBB3777806.1 protease I [Xanthomonas euroxanthea]
MTYDLSGKRIAILATDGFELAELTEPRAQLQTWGATVDVISPGNASKIRSWVVDKWGDEVAVNRPLADADSEDYDALVLPGGVINPDNLRADAQAIGFIKRFAEQDKPVAAICHGPWLLVEAGLVSGRQMTSWASIRTDLVNAGAQWKDETVVIDGGLITSRKPDDVTAFNVAIAESLDG